MPAPYPPVAGRMMGSKHLGEAGNAVVKLHAAGHIRTLEHVFAKNSSAIMDTGHGAVADKTNPLKAGDIFPEKSVKLLNPMALLQNPPCQVNRIVVVSVIAAKCEGAKIRVGWLGIGE